MCYDFKGKTDTIIADSGYVADGITSGGILVYREKEKVENSDTTQAILELITASF